ncbi:MAG: HD domain-containing protein [Chloroflexi bacterium]|nr:HD domain-containing protein [Chloroflexota bacterium]
MGPTYRRRIDGADVVATVPSSSFPSIANVVAGFFHARETAGFLVGGAVRDVLLGRSTADVDFAVAGDVRRHGRELADFLDGHYVLMDPRRDIVRIVLDGKDGSTDSFIDLTPLVGTIDADLANRDFTINALAAPVSQVRDVDATAEIVGTEGGIADLRRGIVRAVSSEVFQNDPGRLLRGPRIATQLRFDIDETTRRMIVAERLSLQLVSPERIRDEFLKLLAQPNAYSGVRMLDEYGLLGVVVPELNLAREVSQPKEHYWDVFNHLVETVGRIDNLLPKPNGLDEFAVRLVPGFEGIESHFSRELSDGHLRLTLLKLTGLLHDIAKPATRSIEPSGRIRFFGHDELGAEMAEDILRRLRVGHHGVDAVSTMIRNHLRPTQMSRPGHLPTRKAMFRFYRDIGEFGIDTLYLNMADYLAARGPHLDAEGWANHCILIDHILNAGFEQRKREAEPRLMNGRDIIDHFGVMPGPSIGRVLAQIEEARAGGDISTRSEAFELARTILESGGNGA